jgi:hypothetical protein
MADHIEGQRMNSPHSLTGQETWMRVFPNLILAETHLRVVHPISVDRTEVYIFPVSYRGSSDETNANRLRRHEDRYGPSNEGPDLERIADAQEMARTGVGRDAVPVPRTDFWRRWREVVGLNKEGIRDGQD